MPEAPDPIAVKLGQRLRKERKSRGMSQEDLGAVLGRSQGSVAAYERGETPLTLSQIRLLAKIFGWDGNEILGLERLGEDQKS